MATTRGTGQSRPCVLSRQTEIHHVSSLPRFDQVFPLLQKVLAINEPDWSESRRDQRSAARCQRPHLSFCNSRQDVVSRLLVRLHSQAQWRATSPTQCHQYNVEVKAVPQSFKKLMGWSSFQWLCRQQYGWHLLHDLSFLSQFSQLHKQQIPIKRKERKSIYIAPFILCIVSKRSDMNHTVLPANYTMPAFPL